MALYPDPLIAVMLPAAAYPVQVVNAARFVANPSNLAAIDDQPWDDNVKAVARFPEVIQYMSDNLNWTVDLGDAFTEQPLELMDAIQALRARAQSAGTLQTTPEQVVIVTNAVVERTFETQIVYVTNTIIQIIPSDPQVVYVPVYNPAVAFAPRPTFVRTAPLITFRPGIRAGIILSNRHVNWYYGGVYYGPGGFSFWGGSAFGRYPYFPPPPHFRPPPYRPRPGWRPPRPGYRPPGFPPPGALPPGRPTPLPIRVRHSHQSAQTDHPPIMRHLWCQIQICMNFIHDSLLRFIHDQPERISSPGQKGIGVITVDLARHPNTSSHADPARSIFLSTAPSVPKPFHPSR